jgi:hypothetical protein
VERGLESPQDTYFERGSSDSSVLASSSDPCPEAGTHRFENTGSVRDGRADPGSAPSSELTLSFTVERTADGRITDASGIV